MKQLDAHYRERNSLLANQPRFENLIKKLLQIALAHYFPKLGPPNAIRPDRIYLTTFTKRYDIHGEEHRKAVSSQTLTQLYKNYLISHQSVTFPAGLSGLFGNSTDLADDTMLWPMRDANNAVNTIEKIIRESGVEFPGAYKRALDTFWNTPNADIGNALPAQWLSAAVGTEVRLRASELSSNTDWYQHDKELIDALASEGEDTVASIIEWQYELQRRAVAPQTNALAAPTIATAVIAMENALQESTEVQREINYRIQDLLDRHAQYLLDFRITPINTQSTGETLPEQELTIYGTQGVRPPNPGDSLSGRKQRIDAYADRVRLQLNGIEKGHEGERNVKFQHTHPFTTPSGYFSGGLLAAGYDPHEKIVITLTAYTGIGQPENLTSSSHHTYSAWEIAAGALAHDKASYGGVGPLNFQYMEIEPKDKLTIEQLEALGKVLQHHWEKDIYTPMRNPSGTLAKRSGKALAYAIRGTLQSLLDDPGSFESLTVEGQLTVGRTLEQNGQIIIPNLYGYPLVGYAFVPYTPYDGDYTHRPNHGLIIDLDNYKVHEIQGDDSFAHWAGENRHGLLRTFNAHDAQGGIDAHWPKAARVLDNLIAGNGAHYEGYYNLLSDQLIPVRELFNYTGSRGRYYRLKHGNLSPEGDDSIAAVYQAVNANNFVWADQTKIFGSSQQSWKAAKEFWGNTFGYLPLVGNSGNIVFGVHDSVYGMTAEDRIQGNAAVVISILQLIHEVLPVGVEIGMTEVPAALSQSTLKTYKWARNLITDDLEFRQMPRPWDNPDVLPIELQGIQKIEFEGKEYFVADAPDAGDGVHYLLRAQDPDDASKLVSSGKIAKPDESGIWRRRGMVGGTPRGAKKVTADMVRAWQKLPKKDTGRKNRQAFLDFLKPYDVPPATFVVYINQSGTLTSLGEALLAEATLGEAFRPVTVEHLKAWRDMPTAERQKTPQHQFAMNNRIYLSDLRKDSLITGELTWKGQYRVDLDAGMEFHRPTVEELTLWRDTSVADIKKTPWYQFARERNINPHTFKSQIKIGGGLSALGHMELNRGGVTLMPPTVEALKAWNELSKAERETISVHDFALRRNLNPHTFATEVKANGELAVLGQFRISKAEGTKFHPVTVEELIEWRDMPEAERKETSWHKFALDRSIDLHSFNNFTKANGELKATAINKIQQANTHFKQLTAQDLRDWRDMLQADRNQTSREQFAASRRLNPKRFNAEARATGELGPLGEFRVNKDEGIKYHEPTAKELIEWRDMSQAERKKTPWHQFALERQINLKSFSNLARATGKLTSVAQFIIRAADSEEPRIEPTHPTAPSATEPEPDVHPRPPLEEDHLSDDDPTQGPPAKRAKTEPMPLAQAQAHAAERAQVLQSQLPPFAIDKTTLAVGVLNSDAGEQRVVVSTSSPRSYMPRSVAVSADELIYGHDHAEANIIEWARQNGYSVLTIGAGRPICSKCARLITAIGATAATPIKEG